MKAKAKRLVPQACRHLLTPVVRFLLRHGFTWKEFADMSKAVYVEVATGDYGLQGRPTNQSRVAILTGLSRREVKRQRDLMRAEGPPPRPTQHPVTRVLAGWHQDLEFTGPDGAPLELPVAGDGASLKSVLRRYGGDIPDVAMIKELRRVGAIENTGDGNVRVLRRSYVPSELGSPNVRMFGSHVHDLADTIQYNLSRGKDQPARFQRVASNESIDRDALPMLRRLVNENGQRFLEILDDWLLGHEVEQGEDAEEEGIRTGVGIYLFEDQALRGAEK